MMTTCEPELRCPERDYERVPVGAECPTCGEDDMDALVWDDDAEGVTCTTCGTHYVPN